MTIGDSRGGMLHVKSKSESVRAEHGTFSKSQEYWLADKEQELAWYREEIIRAKTLWDHMMRAEEGLFIRCYLGGVE